MQKKQIRCYKQYVDLMPNVFNYPVYLVFYEGWSNLTLSTCTNCGELFVIDWENPTTKGLSIIDVAYKYDCPTCKRPLKSTLKEYPKTIKLPNGKLSSYQMPSLIPPDEATMVKEFFEITP